MSLEKIDYWRAKLLELQASFSDPDNELLILAEELGEDYLNRTAALLHNLSKSTHQALNQESEDPLKNLEAMTILAEEYDASGDPLLQRQAEILDQALLILAESDNLDALRKKYKDRNNELAYQAPREELAKSFRIAETKKALDAQKPKNYRPMEAALSTRHCPDHPGVPFLRVADSVYQCSLDHKIFDYTEGFTTVKGNKIPGGSVSNQWNDTDAHHSGEVAFDTRESRINR